MKVTQIVLLIALLMLSLSVGSASASLQLSSMFGFPINFNLIQITPPFTSHTDGLANTLIVNDSTANIMASPVQEVADKSIVNLPNQIIIDPIPSATPIAQPSPVTITPTPTVAATVDPAQTSIPVGTTGAPVNSTEYAKYVNYEAKQGGMHGTVMSPWQYFEFYQEYPNEPKPWLND